MTNNYLRWKLPAIVPFERFSHHNWSNLHMIYLLKVLFITKVNNKFVKNVKQKQEIKEHFNRESHVQQYIGYYCYITFTLKLGKFCKNHLNSLKCLPLSLGWDDLGWLGWCQSSGLWVHACHFSMWDLSISWAVGKSGHTLLMALAELQESKIKWQTRFSSLFAFQVFA